MNGIEDANICNERRSQPQRRGIARGQGALLHELVLVYFPCPRAHVLLAVCHGRYYEFSERRGFLTASKNKLERVRRYRLES